MNWRKRLFTLLMIVIAFRLSAQLPSASIAPDFVAQDINGQTHHLYDVLDSGKIVILEISATWCPPCWVYHTSHAMQDLYAEHGPAGDDKLRVFWVEGDPTTNLNCLYGQAGCNNTTAGNYVAGTPYPIIDNSDIANAYQIGYYPTIYIICPNKRVYEVDPLDVDALWEEASKCPAVLGTNNAGIFNYNPGIELQELCGVQSLAPSFLLTNLGHAPLTAATIELKWNNNPLQTLQWTGNLPTYGEAPIIFDNQNISSTGILKATISGINNGTGDDDFSNNVHNDNFTQATQFNTTQVLLKIRTDSYGEETYWEVRDDFGTVLESGGNQDVGPYGGNGFPLGTPIGPGAYPSQAIIRDTLELPSDGCYTIHFSDAYGDGMCCDFGIGYFKLYNLDNPGTALISGGEFNAYARRAFGAGSLTASSDLSQNIGLQVFPNPASDVLNLEIETESSAEISGQIFNALGQLQHQFSLEKPQMGGTDLSIPLNDWPQGIYVLQLKIGEKTAAKTFLVTMK